MQDSDTAPISPFSDALQGWVRASAHLSTSALEANRAALAAFGLANGEGDGTAVGEDAVETGAADAAPATDPATGDGHAEPRWEFQRSVDSLDEVDVGARVTFTKTLSAEDVGAFAIASGDTNPLHLDDEYAEKTRFRGRIAHGTLVSGLISAALARLPGVAIYLSQDVTFNKPVRVGAELTADVEVTERLDENRFRLSTTVVDDEDDAVIDGEAVVLLDTPPEEQ